MAAGRLSTVAADLGDPNALGLVHNLTQDTWFGTLQAAIDSAVNDDDIAVCPGVYAEQINFNGKAIKLQSIAGPEFTAIDGTGLDGSVVTCDNNETAATLLAGFTVTGGTGSTSIGTPAGGGMFNLDSSPTVMNCRFVRNSANFGGAIYNESSSPTFHGCSFISNRANFGGGAIYNTTTSSPAIAQCTFIANTSGGAKGGAVHSILDSHPVITYCTFIGNFAPIGGALYFASDSISQVTNCILWANAADPIFSGFASAPNVSFSCIQGGFAGVGNIDVNPWATPDGHLRGGSPCIDAGFNAAVADTDRDGDPRLVGSAVDMGSDEFLDSNANGLPDWWQTRYPAVADPNADNDFDQATNLQEYESFSSDPNAPVIFVDSQIGNDSNNGLSSQMSGPGNGPKRTLQAALDLARDGDTILVNADTYDGLNNRDLDFGQKAIVLRSWNSNDPNTPASATIDCGNLTRAVDPATLGAMAVLDHFIIRNGRADQGAGVRSNQSTLQLKDCLLIDNTATDEGGGIHTHFSQPTFDGLQLTDNVSSGASLADAGVISQSRVNLQGNLHLQTGQLDLLSSAFDGPGQFLTEPNAVLNVTGSQFNDSPTIVKSDIRGVGDVNIEDAQQLIIGGSAVLNLSGLPDADCDALGEPGRTGSGGTVTIQGDLILRDKAQVRNTNIDIRLVRFEGQSSVVHNDIRLLEPTPGFGGEFFVDGDVTLSCNSIVSEGDRYLDLSPDPTADPRPNLINNRIDVLIKEGTAGSQGTLLECRTRDYDCQDQACTSGAFQLDVSPGFDDDWVINRLEVRPNAKVNITNRPGFNFQDPNDPDFDVPEAIYVRTLKRALSSRLNVGQNRLYYQQLEVVDANDVIIDPNELIDFPLFTDIPLLGFSLINIAFDDPVNHPFNEFDIRIRKRLSDENDLSNVDLGNPDNPFPEGTIELLMDTPAPGDGLMEMKTFSATSVAAKGAFARAADELITIKFQYLFTEINGQDTELIVYLSDQPDASNGLLEVAHVHPPLAGRPGSVGSGRFATFMGSFPRAHLNFTRGTYVELELRGRNSSCWIDNLDPQVECNTPKCGDWTGNGLVEINDYLLLVAEYGLSASGLGKACLDLFKDGYINVNDLLLWDNDAILNACAFPGTGSGSAVEPPPAAIAANNEPLNSTASLFIFGKPSLLGGTTPENRLYNMDESGACLEELDPTCPNPPCQSSNGRFVADGQGRIYQVHGNLGVIRQEDAANILEPNQLFFDGNHQVTVGIYQDEGLALSDVAFDRSDPNSVYVVPVLVTPQDAGTVGCSYMAAARLQLNGQGSYSVEQLFGLNPNLDPMQQNVVTDCNTVNNFVFEPDFQHLREIEVDVDGYVYVLSAHELNENDWLLVYNQNAGSLPIGQIPLRESGLEGPTAMTLAHTARSLFFASSREDKVDPNDLSARVFCFAIDKTVSQDPNIYFDRIIAINTPEPDRAVCESAPDLCEPAQFIRAITSMTISSCGTLFATGFTAPKFTETANFNEIPFQINQGIFTTPLLAAIPPNTSGPVTASQITQCDPFAPLALPLSIIWTGPPSSDGLVADLTGDCKVNLFDFARIAAAWLKDDTAIDIAPQPLGDGLIDLQEIALLAENWLVGTY
jgi:hypothetical protein